MKRKRNPTSKYRENPFSWYIYIQMCNDQTTINKIKIKISRIQQKKMRRKKKPGVNLEILSEHILRLRFDLASNLLNSILDFCSGVRLDGEESLGTETKGFEALLREEGEEGDEAVFKRLAGWKRSIRVFEEAIFLRVNMQGRDWKICVYIWSVHMIWSVYTIILLDSSGGKQWENITTESK